MPDEPRRPIQLFPEQASTIAPEVDHLSLLLLTVTVFFSVLIFTAILFAVKYRRRSELELPAESALAVSRWNSPGPSSPVGAHHGDVCMGRQPVYKSMQLHPRTRWRSMSSASNGCGSCSTWKDSARSTSCTSLWARPVKLIMTSRGCDPQLLRARLPHQAGRLPGRYTTDGSSPPNRAAIICSAPNTAAPNTRA